MFLELFVVSVFCSQIEDFDFLWRGKIFSRILSMIIWIAMQVDPSYIGLFRVWFTKCELGYPLYIMNVSRRVYGPAHIRFIFRNLKKNVYYFLLLKNWIYKFNNYKKIEYKKIQSKYLLLFVLLLKNWILKFNTYNFFEYKLIIIE